LTLLGHEPTGGHWPRNFALDPAGRFMWVANQESDSITRFAADANTGRLTALGRIAVPRPVCIQFAAPTT